MKKNTAIRARLTEYKESFRLQQALHPQKMPEMLLCQRNAFFFAQGKGGEDSPCGPEPQKGQKAVPPDRYAAGGTALHKGIRASPGTAVILFQGKE